MMTSMLIQAIRLVLESARALFKLLCLSGDSTCEHLCIGWRVWCKDVPRLFRSMLRIQIPNVATWKSKRNACSAFAIQRCCLVLIACLALAALCCVNAIP